MFKPTQILQKSQARLRGQRGPAIRILRKAIRTINPDAIIPPNLMPEHATPPPRAWKEMGIPIHKLMPEHNQRTELPEFSRNQSPEHHAGLISWQDTTRKDLSDSIKNGEEQLPAIVARKGGRIEVPFASQGKVSDSYPVGYKPPAPLYWNHSIYAYNKNTMPIIPATSATARRMIRLYYNMIPRGFNDVLGRQLSRPRYLLRSTFRAFIADRMHNKMPVDSDIMSRVQPRKKGRMAFWRPLRNLSSKQPNVQFKHYSDKVNIATYVYDRRIQGLKHRMAVLGRRLQRTLRMSTRTGWATFGRSCDSWEHWKAKSEEVLPGSKSGRTRRTRLVV
ncbi:hypothetical protein EV356DRAFT_573456 [Viridothelium virens]|uniref:Uncharacterized protein n=1 Tax=Viridothelium virens TaxID=1048519 RepID=A0A6A6HJQ7_VIRVR|nr:hypothetical protein EV356DRAFT_573456 [Viridothelium virens]